jgi:capsular polysaccharide biosynthesis protein
VLDQVFRRLPVLVALAILIIGFAYAAAKPVQYESTGSLVLVPEPSDPRDLPQLLDSVQRSGTLGTYVELLSSGETLSNAGFSGADITVRAIPDTRVITVTAKGEDEDVSRVAEAVMTAGRKQARRLGDPWRLDGLAGASAPSAVPPTRAMVLAVSAVLALLAAVLVLVATNGLGPVLARGLSLGAPSSSAQGGRNPDATESQPVDGAPARRAESRSP